MYGNLQGNSNFGNISGDELRQIMRENIQEQEAHRQTIEAIHVNKARFAFWWEFATPAERAEQNLIDADSAYREGGKTLLVTLALIILAAVTGYGGLGVIAGMVGFSAYWDQLKKGRALLARNTDSLSPFFYTLTPGAHRLPIKTNE